MGIVKARFKTLVGDSALTTEDAERQPRIAGSDEGYSSGSVSDGVGVSINGREDFGDDEVGKRIVGAFGGQDINVSATVKSRFDDSEVRGASCLMKMRETGSDSRVFHSGTEISGKLNTTDVSCAGGDDFVVGENGKCLDENDEELDDKIETINVPIVETSENKDNGEEEDLDEEGFKFSVGDFVWGKIESHPWWPGQIYDPLDASDYALKLKQRNRLLVAYFGDGTFAWCHPSQLKPFEVSFEEMSRQSNSKSFLNAVLEAVDEIGRLTELNMICSCVPKEHCSGLDQPLALNAGIKEGVLLPEGGILKISGLLSKPIEILDEIKDIACRISMNSMLQRKMLESQISAFYRSRGERQLHTYNEPLLISGLEDSLDNDVMDTSKGRVEGFSEEDWLSSPLDLKFSQTGKSKLQKCQVYSGKSQYQRRKQKSIAEIMDSDVGSTAKGARSDENVSPKKERKRKRKLIELSFHTSAGDSSVENGGSKSPSSSKRRKKGEANSPENEPVSDEEQTEKSSLVRERKKSKYLSPPFTSLSKGKKRKYSDEESLNISKEAHVGERFATAANNIAGSSPILKRDSKIYQKKLRNDIDIEHGTLESLGPQTPKQDENETLDVLKVKESTDEVLSELRLVALDPLYPFLTKPRDFVSIFRSSIYRDGSYYKLYNRRRPGRKRKSSNLEQGNLSEDQNQGVDHSSEGKKIRKSKKMNLDKLKSEQEYERLGGKSAYTRPKNKVDSPTKSKNNHDDTSQEKDLPASLFVTFVPGSSLPSKADLLEIYSKFGPLDDVETEMFRDNFCARVSFLKVSDAEEAFNFSQKLNPFGDTNATFRLRYSSLQAMKSRGELLQSEASSPSTVQSSAGEEASQLQFIRKKLEKLISMVENSDGKVSPELKSRLEGEMKGLLDKVSTMVESSS